MPVVLVGSQRISYTGVFIGGGGSLVGPGASPAVAPTLALAAGSGATTGPHGVTVVFETAAGTSLPGPEATITVGVVAAPTIAPTVGLPTAGVGPDPGVHQFAVSFVTSAGETPPSPLSAQVTTVAGITDPAVAPTNPTAPAVVGFGDLTVGHVYSYKQTYGDANGGETLPSAASATATVTATQRLATALTFSTDLRCTRVYLYRSADGGGAPWTRVQIYDAGLGIAHDYLSNVPAGGTYPVDDVLMTQTVAAPTTNTAESNAVPLSGIAVPTSSLVTSKNVYGTPASGSQLKLIANIGSSQTSYIVTTLDASLGADAPTANTAAAKQITTSAPLGPATTTGRRFYMSPSTGGARKLALTIANNTAETGTITASDATLAAAGAEPSSDTSGLAQPAGQVLAGATSIPVAGLGGEHGFQTTGGWARIGNGEHLIRYHGISGNTLTGIPATGSGAIPATIAHSSQITAAPALLGVGDTVIAASTSLTSASRALRTLSGGLTPTQRLGQVLTVDQSSALVTIQLPLGNLNIGGSETTWITIQTGSIGSGGTVLATSDSIAATSIIGTDPQTVTFTLPAPLTLQPATTYYVTLHASYTPNAFGDQLYWYGVYDGSTKEAYQYDDTTVSFTPAMTRFAYRALATSAPITQTIPKGQDVNIFVQVNDVDAQAHLSDLLGGASGIKPTVLQDRRLGIGEATARARAYLALHAYPEGRVVGRSKDVNFTRGAVLASNLAAPTAVINEFKVQTVTISNFTPNIPPDYDFTASTELYTLEDLLARKP